MGGVTDLLLIGTGNILPVADIIVVRINVLLLVPIREFVMPVCVDLFFTMYDIFCSEPLNNSGGRLKMCHRCLHYIQVSV